MSPIDTSLTSTGLTSTGIRRSSEMVAERARTAYLAHHLSSLTLRQSEKALTGIVAFPVATALGVAAAATYCVAGLERVFEVIESALGEVGRAVTSDRKDGAAEHRPERPEARA
jgi:hypothetical protein